jgi:hypothetical protein
VKNRQKTVGIKEKLDVISRFRNVNAVLTYAVILDLLILAYVQFMITLIEIEERVKSETEALV